MATERFQIERRDYFEEFENKGESEVRVNLEKWKDSNKTRYSYAQEWLRLKDDARSLDASSKRDVREEETLAIAKEANSIASRAFSAAEAAALASRSQARWAMIAAIIAMIALISSNKDEIALVISYLTL